MKLFRTLAAFSVSALCLLGSPVPSRATACALQRPPILLMDCGSSMPLRLHAGSQFILCTTTDRDLAAQIVEESQLLAQLVEAYLQAVTSGVQCNWCPPPSIVHCERILASNLGPESGYADAIDNMDGTYTIVMTLEVDVLVTINCLSCGS